MSTWVSLIDHAVTVLIPAMLQEFAYASTGLFAGKPAPTGPAQTSRTMQYLWERACPRKRPGQTTHIKAFSPRPSRCP
ncbi:protein of unknown function [Pseudomonas sp. JV551A1]|uniref:Uncharacterized protein n=1 Tax=Pseudomonas inefficax TaxID=2078786 RepID=A0AAQ1PCA8_9PSED|nr:protein of unknown function [Pseudomonas sp. JV551A1]SPO63007.1 protein of unknown function [Pseudomonas inefficax]